MGFTPTKTREEAHNVEETLRWLMQQERARRADPAFDLDPSVKRAIAALAKTSEPVRVFHWMKDVELVTRSAEEGRVWITCKDRQAAERIYQYLHSELITAFGTRSIDLMVGMLCVRTLQPGRPA
ncbi:hypothetical protein [Methylobacterium sp. 1030]|uniref:hypothetical protein n=1 Tax=Methylobacterium sp. 1030 TaxID=3156404 RepID=UPI00339970F1